MSLDSFVIFMLFIYMLCFQGTFSKKEIFRLSANITDGEQYLNDLIENDSIATNARIPYIEFTAPYRLCQGGCQDGDDTNLAMAFPVFVGKKGTKFYKELYPNLPKDKITDVFKPKPPIRNFTTCAPFRNPRTQSTWYLGYSPSKSDIDKLRGYKKVIKSGTQRHRGYTYTRDSKTRSIANPKSTRKSKRILKAKQKYRLTRKSLKGRDNNINDLKDYVAYPPANPERDYRRAIRDSSAHALLIRNTISINVPSRLSAMRRPVRQRPNEWLPIGFRPVLPIRDKK